MRLIDADALKQADFQDFSNTDVLCAIDEAPTIYGVQCDVFNGGKTMKTWIRITNPYSEETYQVKESKGSIENSISNIERGNEEFFVLTQVLRRKGPMLGKDVRMTINPKNFASFEFWEED